MFFERRVIGSSIYTRVSPRGKWQIDKVATEAYKKLSSLPEEARRFIFRKFCTSCGRSVEMRCSCNSEY